MSITVSVSLLSGKTATVAAALDEEVGPRGSIDTTIMELGPPNQYQDGLLGPNSIIVAYMDPLDKY